MLRSNLVLTVSVVLFLAAVAGAQSAGEGPPDTASHPRPAASAGTEARAACESSPQEPEDPRWRWRLRAYNHLDCVATIVDRALAAAPRGGSDGPGDENQTITMSRADLERIRMLTWWARDAAARIGQ